MFTIPPATAPADPPDDPPGTRVGSIGFSAGPYALFSAEEPLTNSSMLDLAMITAPASRSLRTAVASKGDRYSTRIFEPQVVGRSVVAMLSFTTTGMPARG